MSNKDSLIYKYPTIKTLCETYVCQMYYPYLDIFEEYEKDIKDSRFNYRLSKHPSNKAVEIMIKDPSIINVMGLVENPNPKIGILLEKSKKHFNKMDWDTMAKSCNPVVLDFLMNHADHINWRLLSMNDCDEALDILEKNVSKIEWKHFGQNSNSRAIKLLEQNMDKIELWMISSNPNALHLITQIVEDFGYHHIRGEGLSRNPNAMDILIKNPHLIVLDEILVNPSAISYLEGIIEELKNSGRLTNHILSRLAENPNSLPLFEKMANEGFLKEYDHRSIFQEIHFNHFNHFENRKTGYELDYQAMSIARNKLLEQELVTIFYHPSLYDEQLEYHLNNGGNFDDFNFEPYFSSKIWGFL